MSMGIYKIINSHNNKFYVGSSINIQLRWATHRNELRRGVHKNPRLQHSWNKYGETAFVFVVCKELFKREHLFTEEEFWLKTWVGKPECFNVNVSAFSPRLGIRHTEETKAKIKANRTNPSGENHYRFGKTLSEEVRKKIGDTQRGKSKTHVLTEEGRAKIRAAAAAGHYLHWKGRKHTTESRHLMSSPLIVMFLDATYKIFPSITEARLALGCGPGTVLRSVKSGKPVDKGPSAGFRFAYAESVDIDEATVRKILPLISAKPARPLTETKVSVEGLPNTRAAAKSVGSKYYFTGEPCVHGHVCARKTKGTCVKCIELERKPTKLLDNPPITA